MSYFYFSMPDSSEALEYNRFFNSSFPPPGEAVKRVGNPPFIAELFLSM